jgi:hypothetical protein
MIINSDQKAGLRALSMPVVSSGSTECGMTDSSQYLIRFPIALSAAVNDVKRARTTEWDDSIRWLDPDVVSAATCQRSH